MTADIPTSIFMSHEHPDIPTHRYIVKVNKCTCLHCGHEAYWSEVFAERVFPHRKPVMQRIPLRSELPIFNVPIKRESGAVTETPFCGLCCDKVYLKDLPTPKLRVQMPPSWVGKGDPYDLKKQAKPKQAKTKKEITIDDIIP